MGQFVLFSWLILNLFSLMILISLNYYGYSIIKEKGSIRYYNKPGQKKFIRIDYHGSKEVPTGTCNFILKSAGLK